LAFCEENAGSLGTGVPPSRLIQETALEIGSSEAQ
jgi:hypothetical protein